eukprot:UN28197
MSNSNTGKSFLFVQFHQTSSKFEFFSQTIVNVWHYDRKKKLRVWKVKLKFKSKNIDGKKRRRKK